MKKLYLFLAILIAALASFAVFTAWLTVTYPFRPLGGMMGGMMGYGAGSPSANQPPNFYFYSWVLPFALIALMAISLVGVLYFALLPEIKQPEPRSQTHQYKSPIVEGQAKSELDSVIKALKPDERKVVEILEKHGGNCLQKDITRESEFTRLKTHRIIARLGERNIITVKEHGRTNEITLSSWLYPQNKQKTEKR